MSVGGHGAAGGDPVAAERGDALHVLCVPAAFDVPGLVDEVRRHAALARDLARCREALAKTREAITGARGRLEAMLREDVPARVLEAARESARVGAAAGRGAEASLLLGALPGATGRLREAGRGLAALEAAAASFVEAEAGLAGEAHRAAVSATAGLGRGSRGVLEAARADVGVEARDVVPPATLAGLAVERRHAIEDARFLPDVDPEGGVVADVVGVERAAMAAAAATRAVARDAARMPTVWKEAVDAVRRGAGVEVLRLAVALAAEDGGPGGVEDLGWVDHLPKGVAGDAAVRRYRETGSRLRRERAEAEAATATEGTLRAALAERVARSWDPDEVELARARASTWRAWVRANRARRVSAEPVGAPVVVFDAADGEVPPRATPPAPATAYERPPEVPRRSGLLRDEIHPFRRMGRHPALGAFLRLARATGPTEADHGWEPDAAGVAAAWERTVGRALAEAGAPAAARGGERLADLAVERFEAEGRNVVVAEPALAAELADADLGDVRASDVRLPFDAVFVAFGGVAVGDVGANPAPADGAYLARRGDAIAALVVGRRKAAPGRARWPLGGDPVAEVVVPARRLPGDGGPTLDEAIRAAVGAGRPDGAALLAALRFAFNVVAYATARPADREAFDEVAGPAAPTAPRARPDRARPRRHPDRMTVVLVGGASGARARAEAAAGAVGGVRAAHWRRGHHKRQRHGPGLTLVKVIYVERVYVGGREARGAPRPRVPGRVTRLVAREGRPRAAEGRTGV